MKMATRYFPESSKMSSGVFIIRSSGRVKITLATVAASDTAVQRMVAVAIDRRTPRVSFAPNRWAVITVTPPVKPKKKPSTRKQSGPVAPTAASACTPMVRPTITVSAIL